MNSMVYFLIVAALIAIWAVTVYNRLVRMRASKDEGKSGIAVQLKRRYDLIPNLVAAAKGLSEHEKELMSSVTNARAHLGTGSVKEIEASENAVASALSRFIAVAESYPQIKSDSAFNKLMEDLGKIEEDIQLARRYYNGTARNYNIAVQSFPSNILASAFGFVKAELFELTSEKEAEAPVVKF